MGFLRLSFIKTQFIFLATFVYQGQPSEKAAKPSDSSPRMRPSLFLCSSPDGTTGRDRTLSAERVPCFPVERPWNFPRVDQITGRILRNTRKHNDT